MCLFFPSPFSTMTSSAANPSGIGSASFQVIDAAFAPVWSRDSLCVEAGRGRKPLGGGKLCAPSSRPCPARGPHHMAFCCPGQEASDSHALPPLP